MKRVDLDPRIETVVPKTSKGISAFVKNLLRMPGGSRIEIVFSSKLAEPIPGILDLTRIISIAGHEPVPHIPARGLEEGQLRPYLEKLTYLGVKEVLVIGGDNNPPVGPYHESFQVLEEVVNHNKSSYNKFEAVGLAGHPDGHPHATLADLRRKTVYLAQNGISRHIQTQPSDATTIVRYAKNLKEAGIDAPVLAGIFGPGTAADFLSVTEMIGAKKSWQFLRKNPQVLLAAILSTFEARTSGKINTRIENLQDKLRYGPGNLIQDISSHPDLSRTNIQGIYLFSLKNFGKSVDFYLDHSKNS